MERFVSQIDAETLRNLLSRTVLQNAPMLLVGRSRHIQDISEDGKIITQMRTMELIDPLLSDDALEALKRCINEKNSYTVREELDNLYYDLEILPHGEGAILIYMRKDLSVYDGSFMIIQDKYTQSMSTMLNKIKKFKGLSKIKKIEDIQLSFDLLSSDLRKQCMMIIRMFYHSGLLHNGVSLEEMDVVSEDICPLCKNAAEEMKKRKGRIISLNMPEQCLVPICVTMFKVALYNLITNAHQVTPEDEPLQISIINNPSFVTLTVSDRGRGLESEVFKSLLSGWKRYVSLEEYREFKRKKSPFGFGLPLVKYIAQLHGGTLMFSSREGGGSDFHLIFSQTTAITSESNNRVAQGNTYEPAYSVEETEFSVL